jgi:hypothetical protein
VAAAAGFDRLGKSVAAAAGFDRLGKSVAAAHTAQLRPLFDTKKLVGPMFGGEFQRIAQGLTEPHRASLHPAFDASKMFRIGIGGELQRAAQTMAEAHWASLRPAFDTSKVLRVAMGGERMQQMVAAAGRDKITKLMADSYRVRMPRLFDRRKLVGPVFGGEFQRIARGLADAYQVPVQSAFDFQSVVEVAQDLVDATMMVSSTVTTGSLAVVEGSVAAKAPLFPGLMNPWEQVRCWDLQAWFAFLALLVAVAGVLVAMGQSRPESGLSSEELEKVIRIVQEDLQSKMSPAGPNSPTAPTRSKPTRPFDGEKGHVLTVRPSPTSG